MYSFLGMGFLDFSTPNSVMRILVFEVLISVECVWWWWGKGKMELWILIVLLSAGEGKGESSVKRDIMQVQCVMDIFTLRIHI